MRTCCAALAAIAAFAAGCGDNNWQWGDANKYDKPTIAVMKFDNRAPFSLGWNLGGGTADILVDRLVKTNRYQVIERPELGSVTRELQIQNSGLTRQQGKVQPGRIKNVQYLIKGVITDFGHVSSTRGFFDLDWFNIFGGSAKAVMGITMYVVDVESGQIICSASIQESVRADDLNVNATYKGVAFGGSTFQQTPLGKATSRVIDKAIRRITEVIAAQPWEPRVALVQAPGAVVINGGQNHGLSVGQEYEVLEAGEAVIDPRTGDLLGRLSMRVVGRVRVSDVQAQYAVASVTSGKADDFQVGQPCRRAACAQPKPPM